MVSARERDVATASVTPRVRRGTRARKPKSTYAASVSDAVELVTAKNGTMRHDMKLMTGSNLVGRAVTALARPAPAAQATPTLAVEHSVGMIDDAKPGEVGVIVMEGALDIAAMGNLMATAAVERGRWDGTRRRESRSLGCAPNRLDGLRAIRVAAHGRRPLRHRGQERPSRWRRGHRPSERHHCR